MLILTRNPGQSIIIGDDIKIHILQVGSKNSDFSVKIGIDAPKDVNVNREEVYNRKYHNRIADKGNLK